ncbi:MAG: DNA-3-methyladenine glycosylase [Sediminibacterium sp.]|uniref:DNA-3-methyladenine glycosylase n=1 Tax=Sediminibacterium sp. TaxID=1917865 RepID=UPI002ABA2D1C|nr:DNA-3-methyladenine glycosylase [Sediminibacterium sp.]MDZ4070422.1 DNA-3-methyladenine glycosylase [Sediminibacterium sp.]
MKPLNEYYRNRLPLDFYRNHNVCAVAKQLIGKILVTYFEHTLTAGRIVETEAYNGVIDKASHAYGGRFTNRTAVMYEPGGIAYVYLCYGIHHLFNVVTNEASIPHAVLIRGIEPIDGVEQMLQRFKKTKFDPSIGRGPGNVTKALDIKTDHTGMSLQESALFISDDGWKISKANILATPRIGVDYAEEDASLPYRFMLKGNLHVSKSPFNGGRFKT